MSKCYVDVNAEVGGNGSTDARTGAAAAYVSLAVWEAVRQSRPATPADCVCLADLGADGHMRMATNEFVCVR